ncbi:MAG: hypothetical protein U9O94_00175 [Nanoarchaeota archaeon]|nr:hypothetical protein [Nanoarchaeota archaeon]
MAFSSSLIEFGVMGDLKYEIHSLTDVTADSASTVTTGMKHPKFASAVCEKAASDQINVVSISGQTITLDASTADDDGKLMVFGK